MTSKFILFLLNWKTVTRCRDMFGNMFKTWCFFTFEKRTVGAGTCAKTCKKTTFFTFQERAVGAGTCAKPCTKLTFFTRLKHSHRCRDMCETVFKIDQNWCFSRARGVLEGSGTDLGSVVEVCTWSHEYPARAECSRPWADIAPATFLIFLGELLGILLCFSFRILAGRERARASASASEREREFSSVLETRSERDSKDNCCRKGVRNVKTPLIFNVFWTCSVTRIQFFKDENTSFFNVFSNVFRP